MCAIARDMEQCGYRATVHECGWVVKEVCEEYEREGDNSEWLGSRGQPEVGGLVLEMSLIEWIETKWQKLLHPQRNRGNQTKYICYPGQSSSGLFDMKTGCRKVRIQEKCSDSSHPVHPHVTQICILQSLYFLLLFQCFPAMSPLYGCMYIP